MKIYIAGSWSERGKLKEIGLLIAENLKHEITSTWFYEQDHAKPFPCAVNDLRDIDRSDCVLIFMSGESTKGGRMVELGYSLARRKNVAIIGSRSNVFTYLVPCFETWQEALQ